MLTVRATRLKAAMFLACLTAASGTADAAPHVRSLSLRPAALTVPVGQAKQLKVTARLTDGRSRVVTRTARYALAPRGIVTVVRGRIVGRKVGTTILTVRYGGRSARRVRIRVTAMTTTPTTPGSPTTATPDPTAPPTSGDTTPPVSGGGGTTTPPAPTAAERLEASLTDGTPNVVSRQELIAAARHHLSDRLDGGDLLPTTAMTWNPTNESWRANQVAAGYQVPLLVSTTAFTGSGTDRIIAAVGSTPASATRIAFFALNPFGLKNAGAQTDAGMNALDENVVAWLLGESTATSQAKIVLSNVRSSWDAGTNAWFAAHVPNATLTATNVCDFPIPQSCLDGAKLLVVGGGVVGSGGAGNADAAAQVAAAQKAGIPVVFFGDTFDPSSLTPVLGSALGMAISTQYFNVTGVQAATQATQLAAGVDQLGNDVTLILDRLTTNPLSLADYDACLKGANQDLQGWTWQTCRGLAAAAGEPVQAYLNALTRLRATLTAHASGGTSPFGGRRTTDVDLIRMLVLLADKARTGSTPSQVAGDDATAISYPVDQTDGVALGRAMFADYVTPTTWAGNQAAADLGTLWCSRTDLLADTCAEPTYVDIGAHTVTLAATAVDEWQATGVTLPAGRGATATLEGDPGVSVWVRTFYQRIQTSRTVETSGGVSSYDRPQYAATDWVLLKPGVATAISSPYGGPLYIRIAGTAAVAGTGVTVAFGGVGTHPAILDMGDAAQLAAFAARVNDGSFYADLAGQGFQMHTPIYRIRKALDPFTTSEGRVLDYGGPTGVGTFLTDFRDAFVFRVYGLAGLAIPGKTLAESLPADVQTICANLGMPCLDPALNSRSQIQHVNYDPFASCGALCSGNPFDSSGNPNAIGWGENHELGHNLQRPQLDIHWVDTAHGTAAANRNVWTNYVDRSGEVSNNIFPAHTIWKYWRTPADTADLHRSVAGETAFLITQSLRAGTTRGGQLVALKPNGFVGGALQCATHMAFPIGTDTKYAIADAIWSNPGSYDDGDTRLGFYLQIPMIAHGMVMSDGTTLSNGWDIWTLLYQSARRFSAVSDTEAHWDAAKAGDGFSLFDYTGAPTYGGKTVAVMPGNDFLLIQLSRLTGHDWRPIFASYGVLWSDLADAQVTANAPGGGLVPIGDVRYALSRQFPRFDLHSGATPLVDMSAAATPWPGVDNNANGLLTDAGDYAGLDPSDCP